ncbi:MAG: hypothetical protein C0P68_000285 [Bacillota bacterium]
MHLRLRERLQQLAAGDLQGERYDSRGGLRQGKSGQHGHHFGW